MHLEILFYLEKWRFNRIEFRSFSSYIISWLPNPYWTFKLFYIMRSMKNITIFFVPTLHYVSSTNCWILYFYFVGQWAKPTVHLKLCASCLAVSYGTIFNSWWSMKWIAWFRLLQHSHFDFHSGSWLAKYLWSIEQNVQWKFYAPTVCIMLLVRWYKVRKLRETLKTL